MDIDLAALIVDERSDEARSLMKALAPEVTFVESDYTNSVHRAIQSHSDADYNICFLADAFPAEELTTFFNDIRKLGKDQTCVFIQVRSDLPEDFDRKSLCGLGISTVISRNVSHADKQAIEEVLRSTFHEKEVIKRKLDVHGALRILLKELDKNAADRKRGVNRKMAAIPMDLVEMNTAFDEEVLANYYETLETQTAEAQPIAAEKLSVPEKVLGKKLPGLEKDIYRGASSRVWGMLLEKHGEKKSTPTESTDEDHSTTPDEPEDK